MLTLEDYAAQRFPEHRIKVRPPAVSLGKHTTVGQVKGAGTAAEVTKRLRREFPIANVGSALVLPNDSTVVATEMEDTEGTIDLPRKRPAIVAGMLALFVGIVGLFAARQAIDGWAGAIIAAVFLAVVAGVIGALLGGAGRYAGDRAWEQARQGDEVIGLVAVCLDEEAPATRVAATLEEMGLTDVRIVGADGAWHVPNT